MLAQRDVSPPPLCRNEPDSAEAIVACLAEELLIGLRRAEIEFKDAPLRVAVFPFDSERIPVPADRAADFNDRLVAALVQRGHGAVVVIAREDLREVIRDLEETGALQLDNPVPALIESARVDVLIVGRMQRDQNDLRLRYQATRTSGRPETVAATDWRTVRGGATVSAQGDLLDQVARAAARQIRERAPDLRLLRLAGLSYQDTGLRTPIGDAIEGHIVRDLEEVFASALSDRRLRVARQGLRDDGGAERGAYVLSGSYWEQGDTVEVRVRLEGAGGHLVSFRSAVRRDDLPPGRLRPPGEFGLLAENQVGPIRLQLDSDRGRTPSYAIGERFSFLLRTDVDAYVYCFYLQADDTLVKIFPNSRHTDARLAGGEVHEMPGAAFPFSLDVLPPAGIELLKCYATQRDVTADLPAPVRENALRPLPPGFRFRLSSVFRALPDSGTTEASLPITVTEAR
ncbi:MAG: DUF4384 domain-containing protein [Alphaproteobacteria bacterium]